MMSERYEQDVIKSAEQNHIWLNAFQCLNPSDEFKIKLADAILGMLDKPSRRIHSDFDDPELCKLHEELIVRINKS